jgi:hypothetical protein
LLWTTLQEKLTDVPVLLGDILEHLNTISSIISSYRLSERLKNDKLEQLASVVHKLNKMADNLDSIAETKVHLELLFIELIELE